MDPDFNPTATLDVHFRPVKRQKFLRKRIDDDGGESPSLSENVPTPPPPATIPADLESQPENSDPHEDDASNVVRLRKPQRVRRGGIEFSTQAKSKQESSSVLSKEMSAEDLESESIRAKFDRFTAFTGLKVDVNKHMYGLQSPKSSVFFTRRGLTR